MDTKKLELLVNTVEYGSINKAAEQLGYTQSGLAYLLNSLEDEIGLPLLNRSRSGVHYSPECEILLPYISESLKSQKSLEQAIERLKGRNSTLLRLGTYNSIALEYLADVVSEFRLCHPEISVSLTIGAQNLIPLLTNDELDFIIAEKHYADNFEWEYLFDDEMCLAVPLDNPISQKCSISLEEMSKEPIIYSSQNTKNAVLATMESRGLNVCSTMSIGTLNGEFLMQMAARGFGLAYISRSYQKVCPPTIRMISITPPIFRSIGVVAKSIKGLPSPCRKVIQSLKKKLKTTSAIKVK